MQAAWVQNQWTPTNDSSLDPGWMLPTVVLSRVYSSYLNTAPDAHMYRLERPLPLEELYNSKRPEAGLLALLKFALWQVLWAESSTSESSIGSMVCCYSQCMQAYPHLLCLLSELPDFAIMTELQSPQCVCLHVLPFLQFQHVQIWYSKHLHFHALQHLINLLLSTWMSLLTSTTKSR